MKAGLGKFSCGTGQDPFHTMRLPPKGEDCVPRLPASAWIPLCVFLCASESDLGQTAEGSWKCRMVPVAPVLPLGPDWVKYMKMLVAVALTEARVRKLRDLSDSFPKTKKMPVLHGPRLSDETRLDTSSVYPLSKSRWFCLALSQEAMTGA